MEPAAKKKDDTFKFFSFLQCSRTLPSPPPTAATTTTTNTATRHSKSWSADSGISSGEAQRSNNPEVVLISDDEDTLDATEFEFELLCEVEFETGKALPLPIEQKLICKVEAESIQERSFTSATTSTPRSQHVLPAEAANLDLTLDQANFSECEEELLSLIKHEPNCNLNAGDATLLVKSGGGSGGASNNYFIYICPQCGAAFETSGGWSEHIDREHQLSDQRQFNFTQRPNNKFECNKCHAVITRCTLKTLQQHRFTHLPHKPYKCKLCRFEARSLYMMISHIMLHKEREELGETTICATTTPAKNTAAALKQAELDHECRLLIAYVCPACGISFDEEDAWQAHINFRHDFLEKTAENRFEDHFKCSECNVEIFSQHIADLQQHLFTHLPFKSFLKCKLCNWTISRRNFMISHIFNLHKNHLSRSTPIAARTIAKPPLAISCLFDYDNELEDDGLSPPANEEEFSSVSTPPPPMSQLRPRRSNVNDNSFNANVSSASENSNTMLRTSPIDQSTTTTSAAAELRSGYCCSGCNRLFPTSAERNAHNLAEHAKYKCKTCHKSFAVKKDMKRHFCEDKKPMQCAVCLKDYTYENSFRKHIKRCRKYVPRARKYSESD